MSIDGYLDDASGDRLLLSSAEDFAQVDVDRAAADAILIGANTVRRDNPRLLVRSPDLIERRQRDGRPPSPVKVTISAGGNFDPHAAFFTAGDVEKLVYVASEHVAAARSRLGAVATVVDAGEWESGPPASGVPGLARDLGRAGEARSRGGAGVSSRGGAGLISNVLADLRERGVARLLAEGGSSVLTQLLTQGLVDELLVSIAPIFVGDSAAPRFVGDGSFPFSVAASAQPGPQGAAGLRGAEAQQQAGGSGRRMTLAGVRQLGDCVRIRYLLTDEDGR